MKKLFLIITLAFTAIHLSYGQDQPVKNEDIKFGVKAGLNIANIVGDDAGNTDVYLGFNAGFFAEFKIDDKFSIQPEILYSAQGAKSDFNLEGIDFDATLKFSYINVPVMAKYKFTDKFSLEAGPYIGFLTSAKVKVDSDFGSGTEDIDDIMKSIDFGIGLGINFEFTDVIFANIRYNAGLTELGDTDEDNDIKNSVFNIGLGFRF